MLQLLPTVPPQYFLCPFSEVNLRLESSSLVAHWKLRTSYFDNPCHPNPHPPPLPSTAGPRPVATRQVPSYVKTTYGLGMGGGG